MVQVALIITFVETLLLVQYKKCESVRIIGLEGAATRPTIQEVLSRSFLMKEHAYFDDRCAPRETHLAAAVEGGNEI